MKEDKHLSEASGTRLIIFFQRWAMLRWSLQRWVVCMWVLVVSKGHLLSTKRWLVDATLLLLMTS